MLCSQQQHTQKTSLTAKNLEGLMPNFIFEITLIYLCDNFYFIQSEKVQAISILYFFFFFLDTYNHYYVTSTQFHISLRVSQGCASAQFHEYSHWRAAYFQISMIRVNCTPDFYQLYSIDISDCARLIDAYYTHGI